MAEKIIDDGMENKKNTKLARTIYLRFPKRINDADEVRNLITGEADIKLRRQETRHCYITFSKMEDKIKNMVALKAKSKKEKLRLVVSGVDLKKNQSSDDESVTTKIEQVKTKVIKMRDTNKIQQDKKKPIKIDKLTSKKLKRAIIVCGIPKNTSLTTVKAAFPDCRTIAWIKDEVKSGVPEFVRKRAVVKFEKAQIAFEYCFKKRAWPIINGQQVEIKEDHRKATRAANRRKSTGLKIYGVDDINDTNDANDIELKSEGNEEQQLEENDTTSDAVIGTDSNNDETVGENVDVNEENKVE